MATTCATKLHVEGRARRCTYRYCSGGCRARGARARSERELACPAHARGAPSPLQKLLHPRYSTPPSTSLDDVSRGRPPRHVYAACWRRLLTTYYLLDDVSRRRERAEDTLIARAPTGGAGQSSALHSDAARSSHERHRCEMTNCRGCPGQWPIYMIRYIRIRIR